MKKKHFLKLILPLIFLFLALSCTLGHLKHEVVIEDEVAHLIRNAPSVNCIPMLA